MRSITYQKPKPWRRFPFGTTSYRSGRTETEVSLKRYKHVGKERDEETGLYYYGARYYAGWLGRFVSVDPLQHKYPHYTPYQYAGNKPITFIDLDGLEENKPLEGEKIIFFGGSREKEADGSPRKKGISDNNTFEFAAHLLEKKYQNNVTSEKISSAKDILDYIGQKEDSSIKRFDIISHGTPGSLNFSEEENVNIGFYASRIAKVLVEQYYRIDDPEENEGYTLDRSKGARNISEIDYDKFTSDALVELHGCRTGMTLEDWNNEKDALSEQQANILNNLVDNIAINMSEELYSHGKEQAVVVAHTEPSTSDSTYGYQKGERVVYHNGEVLLRTTMKGDLFDAIQEKLSEKPKKLKWYERLFNF